jgi:hypothetical protein
MKIHVYFHSKDFEKRFKWTGIGSISIDPSKINDAIMKQNSAKISKAARGANMMVKTIYSRWRPY